MLSLHYYEKANILIEIQARKNQAGQERCAENPGLHYEPEASKEREVQLSAFSFLLAGASSSRSDGALVFRGLELDGVLSESTSPRAATISL